MKTMFTRLIAALVLLFCQETQAQTELSTALEPGEYWYGALVNEGNQMPFTEGYQVNLFANTAGNQAAPLLLSSTGRYIWSDEPFAFQLNQDSLHCTQGMAPIQLFHAGNNLKSAYHHAMQQFFPYQQKLPDTLLFSRPQYNTWIELIYNQNQEDILRYAENIIANGFPPGVLMIDDNWAPYYGRFRFRQDRFPDAQAMISRLHTMGFKVMVWVCPFINPVSEESRFLLSKKWVLMNKQGVSDLKWSEAKEPAIINWWNGYSMVMDFTNPEAVHWFKQQLDGMTNDYGLDGFKFDAGDPEYYAGETVAFRPVPPNTQTALWGSFGLGYPLNEYRAMWKQGGQPIVERLRDKQHSWNDLKLIIPDMMAAGLLGYGFACPDMIGGGEYGSFIKGGNLDQELIVRSAKCQTLMPMMQFSVAPWRVLDSLHFAAVKKMLLLRKKITPYILSLAHACATEGEPIVRHMEYVFPHQGFQSCQDQFMLGDSILVTPMLDRGAVRTVRFPKGKWVSADGTVIKGPIVRSIKVPLDELLWFRREQ